MRIRISDSRRIQSGHFDGIADIIFNDGKTAAILESEQTGHQGKASNIQQFGTRKFDA